MLLSRCSRIYWKGYLHILGSVSCSGTVPLKFKDPIKPIIPRSSFELNLFDDIAWRVSCRKCPVIYFAKMGNYGKMYVFLRTFYANNKRCLFIESIARHAESFVVGINKLCTYLQILRFTKLNNIDAV